jgi:hypothetical protein
MKEEFRPLFASDRLVALLSETAPTLAASNTAADSRQASNAGVADFRSGIGYVNIPQKDFICGDRTTP